MNEKYLAGFIDADGHISVRPRLNARPNLDVSLAQRASYKDALLYAQREFGGSIRIRKVPGQTEDHAELLMRYSSARKCLERLKKYLVLKKHHAERMIELTDASPILRTLEQVQDVRRRTKEIRGYGADSMPNFPSRKWLAGYFDGDGSLVVKVCRKTGYAYPSASLMAAQNYTVGILLLQKVFGGKICSVKNNAFWQLQLSQPSKAKEFLGYFAKYLVVKRAQAYFLLGCAEHNFRDGAKVREHMNVLNSQQHRLSDPEGAAAQLVSEVDFSIPTKWVRRSSMRQSKNRLHA